MRPTRSSTALKSCWHYRECPPAVARALDTMLAVDDEVIVVTAIARELLAFMWAIGQTVTPAKA